MQYTVKVEEPSLSSRRLTIKVAAGSIAERIQSGLAHAQRTAKLKGFRPGHVPINIIEQQYGDDVRHNVYHSVIDESFRSAIRDQKIRAVGQPQIETEQDRARAEHDHDHSHDGHDHDHDHSGHALDGTQDFTFVATVDIVPEIDVKGYAGVSLTKTKATVSDAELSQALDQLRDSHADLVAVGGGLVGPSGKPTSRPAEKGDFLDLTFSGGVVTALGVEPRDGMKGQQVFELGNSGLLPEFEAQLPGMRAGESKTFRMTFPADYGAADLAGKEAEFTITANELKTKKVPELNDEFAKKAGHETVDELKSGLRQHLENEKARDSDRKLKSDLLKALIEKNPFDCPKSLIEAQMRSLAQDVATQLKREQGLQDPQIEEILRGELDNLRKKAENQVRASLILEAVGRKESLTVTPTDVTKAVEEMAAGMKIEPARLHEMYEKNEEMRDNLEFRLREDQVVKFLLSKAKIKET